MKNKLIKTMEEKNMKVVHIEKNDVSEQEDLVTDLVSMMVSFSGKMYGRRSAERRKKKKEVKDCKNSCRIK